MVFPDYTHLLFDTIRVSNGLDTDQDRHSVLICIQTVCKGIHQTKTFAASKEIVKRLLYILTVNVLSVKCASSYWFLSVEIVTNPTPHVIALSLSSIKAFQLFAIKAQTLFLCL